MPGLSLKFDVSKVRKKAESCTDDLFFKALDSTLYDGRYKVEILLEDYPYTVACTKYPSYPIKILQDNNYWICIEGRLYNKEGSLLQKEINDLMNYLFDSNSDIDRHEKTIVDWLLETDGEFIIYALNKVTKDFAIVNDVLGRLPLYYYHKKNKELLVSREAYLLSELIHHYQDNPSKFDKMGIAQYLLFCHTFGKRTILRDMYRLEPASILRICNMNSEVKIDNLFCFNFEEKKYYNESVEKSARRLVSLFSEACKSRANDNGRNLISLSGGFDSRAVAASFDKNKIRGSAVTFYRRWQTAVIGSTPETQVAQEIANLFGLEWQNSPAEPKGSQLLSLLKIKSGLSPLSYSHLLAFLEVQKNSHRPSETTIFTGHGGDMIFANIKPGRRKKHGVNLDRLVRGIIQERGYLSLSDVAALVKSDEDQIINEIKNVISLYPEKYSSYKYIHYLFYETTFKIDHEAEDIHRYYFWSVSPFYSIPFFDYAINCVGENKSPGDLYREFLFELSPSGAEIKNSNWGCSILSKRYKLLQFLQSFNYRHPKLKKIIRRITKKTRVAKDDPRIRAIRGQINSCNDISDILSFNRIEEILKNHSCHTRVGIDNLFTITSLIERISCDNSSIQRYYGD